MEQNITFRLLESIGKVYEQSKDCKLDSAFFEKVDVELKHLSDCSEETLVQNQMNIGFKKL